MAPDPNEPGPASGGRVQIYTGDGKGKTTAALGLAFRALGQGLTVLFVQFMKEGMVTSGEVLALEKLQLEGLDIHRFGRSFIFEPVPTKEEVAQRVAEGMTFVREQMKSGAWDIIVMDEITVALHYEVVKLDDVLALIGERPAALEMVLTGRKAPQALIDAADLVTEMRMIRHPYDSGAPARKGIEY